MATVTHHSTHNGTGSMSHAGRSEFIDHTQETLARLNEQAYGYLVAMGIEAVKCINQQMENGYGKPIWQTGDLMRDVSYQVHNETCSVDVGNTLEYALFVHDGTRHMEARPYIRDAILNNKSLIIKKADPEMIGVCLLH